jgi:1-aminocyclopropane-1-carboxylate deaminase/D-cysteine desulfhydrase-like pyridoxal-dependent ACC family enzyme
MKFFEDKHQIPLDRVYTAKMFFAVFDLLNKAQIPPKSRILLIHTGGLQGNRN